MRKHHEQKLTKNQFKKQISDDIENIENLLLLIILLFISKRWNNKILCYKIRRFEGNISKSYKTFSNCFNNICITFFTIKFLAINGNILVKYLRKCVNENICCRCPSIFHILFIMTVLEAKSGYNKIKIVEIFYN